MTRPKGHTPAPTPQYDNRGYILCRACHRPVTEISKATSFSYAYHPEHRPWNKAAVERETARQAFFDRMKIERKG